MPEFQTTYRGRKAFVHLDMQGTVLDIYPQDRGDNFIVTENDKIAFELEYNGSILDVMEEYESEVAEYKKSRGRM